MEFKEDEDMVYLVKKYSHKVAHVEIQILKILNEREENLYHTIGKKAAGMILRGELEIPVFDKYIELLKEIENETQRRKKAIIAIGRTKKKKAV